MPTSKRSTSHTSTGKSAGTRKTAGKKAAKKSGRKYSPEASAAQAGLSFLWGTFPRKRYLLSLLALFPESPPELLLEPELLEFELLLSELWPELALEPFPPELFSPLRGAGGNALATAATARGTRLTGIRAAV